MQTIFTPISGKIKQNPTGPVSESCCFLGTALDGPLNKPIQITDYTSAEALFGPASYSNGHLDPRTGTESGASNGATIPLDIMQAINSGCTNIWVCRVSGNTAAGTGAFSSFLDVRALYPGRIYNGVTLNLAPVAGAIQATFTQPTMKGSTVVTTFSSGLNVLDLITAINTYPQNKTIHIHYDTFPSTWYNNAYTSIGTGGTVTLQGGTYGTRAVGEDFGPDQANGVNGLATCLTGPVTGTFDTLEGLNQRFDSYCLNSIYFDDQVVNGGSAGSTTIAWDFAQFLDNQTINIGPTRGFMSVRPPRLRDDSSIVSYLTNNLLNTTPGLYSASRRWINAGAIALQGFLRTDGVVGIKDFGGLLSVIAGPEVLFQHPDIGVYSDMWHPTYAATLTTVPPESSLVGKSLPAISGYGVKYPKQYVDSLVNGVGYDPTNNISGSGAFVCLISNKNNVNGPMMVYDDPTMSSRSDYFRQDQLTHLVNSIMNDVDLGLQPFYGGPTNAQAIAAMETVVTNIMEGYNNSGGVMGSKGNGYDFRISLVGNDAELGAIHVYLEINPSRALRRIYLTLAVRNPTS